MISCENDLYIFSLVTSFARLQDAIFILLCQTLGCNFHSCTSAALALVAYIKLCVMILLMVFPMIGVSCDSWQNWWTKRLPCQSPYGKTRRKLATLLQRHIYAESSNPSMYVWLLIMFGACSVKSLHWRQLLVCFFIAFVLFSFFSFPSNITFLCYYE